MTGTMTITMLLSVLNVVSYTTQSHLVISLTKTQCFGQCPAYDFELYADCTAKFNGKNFTEKMGFWESTVTKEQLNALISEFEKASFFTFEDRYYKEISDLPTTYIYYSNGSMEKKVMDYYGAPVELKNLELKVEELIEQLEWKPTKTN